MTQAQTDAPDRGPAAVGAGPLFMVAAVTVFAVQDGISKLLVLEHPPVFIAMLRYWAFAAFVIALSATRPGGVRAAARSARPWVQILRGCLLAAQIVLVTFSFAAVGLAETHAVMAFTPLLVAAMGATFLGERVTARGWAAIAAGAAGVLFLLAPKLAASEGGAADGPGLLALTPLACAVIFASYNALTRWVGDRDPPSVSFFYTGVAGCAVLSLIGPFYWSELQGAEWGWMALLCVTGAGGHYLLIKAYERSEAARLQPIAYLQAVLASAIGVLAFAEPLTAWLLVGGGVVIAAGLYGVARPKARSLARRG